MPIPTEQKIIAVAFSLILFAVILQLIRKHKLREEYALTWFAVSVVIVLLSLFDGILAYLASLLAVVYAPTLILVFGILFCVVLLLAQTVLLSTQANRLRDLAQSVGLLEWQVRQLEGQRANEVRPQPSPPNGQWNETSFALEAANEKRSAS